MDKNWKEVVDNDLQSILANYSDEQLNFTLTNTKYTLLAIFLLFLGIIPGVILFIFIRKANRIEREILQKLDIVKYYQIAFAQESANKLDVKNIVNNFEIPIKAFFPSQGSTKIDPVLNITNSHCSYSFGTVTEKIVTITYDSKGHPIENIQYFRFPFLTISLDKTLEMNTVMSKSKSFLGMFKTKDNTELESSEFEKMYAITTNDQIAIRKLLTPKVMANLLDLGTKIQQIPSLSINETTMTYSFANFLVQGWTDPKGAIGKIDLKNKKAQILEDICSKIIRDYDNFTNCKQWFDMLQIYWEQ